MTIKERFLKLTEYTTPFGKESELIQYLPSNLIKDDIGNYYIKIGTSDTMFTCHLDNVCKNKQKVNHIIDNNFIKTDKTTILGADNKAGVCVLSHMIENNIPGLYYFFIGEEPSAPDGGLYGSKHAYNRYKEKFKLYKKCIAFDRKEYGSIINRQMATKCCSDEFVNSLIKEFKKYNLVSHLDSTGYYTDTAVFMNVIQECTNISVGCFHEHSKNEKQDILYLEKLCDIVCKIDWENLEVKREFNKINYNKRKENISKISKYEFFKKVKEGHYKKIFRKVCTLLDDYSCINSNNFQPGIVMMFSEWFKDSDNLNIVIDYDENIWLNDKKIGDFEEFKYYYIKKYNYNILKELDVESLLDEILVYYKENYKEDLHYDKINDRFILTYSEFEDILEELFFDFSDFLLYFNEFDNDKRLNFIEIDKVKKLIYIYDK